MKVTSLPNIAATRAALPPSAGEPAAAISKLQGLSLSSASRAPDATPQTPLQQASRLSALRDEINEGRYNINADLIAERVLQWQL